MVDTLAKQKRTEIARLVFTLFLKDEDEGAPYEKEVLTINQKKGHLSIDQYSSGKIIRSCRYYLAEKVNEILMRVQGNIDTINWVAVEENSRNQKCDHYQLEIEYYDDTSRKHSGLYDCWQVSAESLIALISSVDDIFVKYNTLSMFDVHSYLNVNEIDRVKYCSVLLPLGDELYYYQTDDESIENDDRVVVKFGVNEAEMEGIVKETRYYALDEVPFPLDKTKRIITKL